jgi:hypothetical protein
VLKLQLATPVFPSRKTRSTHRMLVMMSSTTWHGSYINKPGASLFIRCPKKQLHVTHISTEIKFHTRYITSVFSVVNTVTRTAVFLYRLSTRDVIQNLVSDFNMLLTLSNVSSITFACVFQIPLISRGPCISKSSWLPFLTHFYLMVLEWRHLDCNIRLITWYSPLCCKLLVLKDSSNLVSTKHWTAWYDVT